ncbi:MAG: hypothetical protein WBX15_18460 [Thermoanaerobaculia bacterium]
MDTFLAVIPAADPLALPAPPWLLHTLLILTFFFHVVAMNFVLGGSLIAAVERLRGAEGSRELTAWMGKLMPTMVAAAVTFGVAPLLFLQTLYGRIFFPSSVQIAWFWFAVVPILICAYYGTYLIAFRKKTTTKTPAAIAVVVSLLFLAIAFVYSNNMSLMLRPDVVHAGHLADARGLTLNTSDPTFLPRFLHMLFGAVAVAGLVIAIYGLAIRGKEEATGIGLMRKGAAWFSVATVLAMVAGFWWMSRLPLPLMKRFMGGSVAGTVVLALGVMTGLASLAFVLGVRRSDRPAWMLKTSIPLVVVTLVLMLLARDQVREGMLEAAGFQITGFVEPQWGVISLFVLLLLGGVAVAIWMGMLLRGTGSPEVERTAGRSEGRQPAPQA